MIAILFSMGCYSSDSGRAMCPRPESELVVCCTTKLDEGLHSDDDRSFECLDRHPRRGWSGSLGMMACVSFHFFWSQP